MAKKKYLGVVTIPITDLFVLKINADKLRELTEKEEK
jgi:hypothetical protein